MKKQVLIIGGAMTFDKYQEYIEFLQNITIDIERIKPGYDWKSTIQQDLGDNYEVLAPSMPNKNNAKYKEWKIWFENILSVVNKDVILVGHSMGGVFLAKYLSEHLIDNNIGKLVLLAAPYSDTPEESIGSFKLTKPFTKLIKQVNNVVLVYSQDDTVVPYNDGILYQKSLPGSKLVTFKDKGHFNMPNFPELADIIKS